MTIEKNKQIHAILTKAHHNFENSLATHAYFKTNCKSTSKDLVQDTFLKAWKYLVKGGKIEIMKAFLYHVLNNLIVDQYRKKKAISLDALIEKGFEPKATDSDRLFNVFNVFNVIDGKAALHLIERLPASYQKVMHMRYVEDLSLNQMSDITGQSKNTLAVKAHRGLEKLKELYYAV